MSVGGVGLLRSRLAAEATRSMKRIASTQAGFVLMSSCLCLAALGCNKHVIEDPVTVVQTRTPGVAFVIVRPT